MTSNKEIIHRKIHQRFKERADEVGELITKTAKELLRGKIGKPSPILDDIQYRIEEESGKISLVIFTTNPITLFLEKGTKPHIIRPKNKKALAFEVWHSGVRKDGTPYKAGDKIATRIVRHPGTEAMPYFSQAIFLTKEQVMKILES